MNAVKDMTFTATIPVFTGSFKKSKFSHNVQIKAKVTHDCCYSSDNKHWLYFVVLESDSPDYQVGKEYKKQGKNFYSQVTSYAYPENYEAIASRKAEYKANYGIGGVN